MTLPTKHFGESFSQGVRLLRIVHHDGREQTVSITVSARSGWTARRSGPDGVSEEMAVRRQSLLIGSSRGADLVFGDPLVADQHCQIVERDGHLVLVDRGSRSGTFINGVRCREPTRLKEGDRVEFGGSLIEVMQGRAQFDVARVHTVIQHQPEVWEESEDELRAKFYQALRRQAQEWRVRGQPRSSLLERERLERAVGLLGVIEVEEEVRVFLRASARRLCRCQGIRWAAAGFGPGIVLGVLLVSATTPSMHSPVEVAREDPSESVEEIRPPPQAPERKPCTIVEHKVVPVDDLHYLSRYYREPEDIIADRNRLNRSSGKLPSALQVCTNRQPLQREEVTHVVAEGESWEQIAALYGESANELRRQLPDLAGVQPSPGSRLSIWVPALMENPSVGSCDVAEAIVPEDTGGVGEVNDGILVDPVRVNESSPYDVRCDFNAYAAGYTFRELDKAIRCFRKRSGYRGQIVLGDLSRKSGGKYGNHLSHQTGRDVDIWLPIRGGAYRDNCRVICGTRWCRPKPGEVDWRVTWLLIKALYDGRAVKQIFLDRSLMPALKKGAREANTADGVIDRLIRGSGGFVSHSANHTHHIHVRFRCGPGESGCVE